MSHLGTQRHRRKVLENSFLKNDILEFRSEALIVSKKSSNKVHNKIIISKKIMKIVRNRTILKY